MVVPKEPADPGYGAPAPGAGPAVLAACCPQAAGRRRRLTAGVAACLVLAGVGWAAWPGQPAAPSPHLVAGTVQADLLTSDQVSKLAGVSVVSGPGSDEPPAAISASPRCPPRRRRSSAAPSSATTASSASRAGSTRRWWCRRQEKP